MSSIFAIIALNLFEAAIPPSHRPPLVPRSQEQVAQEVKPLPRHHMPSEPRPVCATQKCGSLVRVLGASLCNKLILHLAAKVLEHYILHNDLGYSSEAAYSSQIYVKLNSRKQFINHDSSVAPSCSAATLFGSSKTGKS